MCYSATASFAAGGSLVVVGALTLSKAKGKAELPLASTPLLLGVQQILEGAVWSSFDSPSLNRAATHAFLSFALVLWPVFVPLAVALIERNPLRRQALGGFVLMGVAVGAYLLFYLARGPVASRIENHSIAYDVPYPNPSLVLAFYLVATCVSCLFSSYRMVNVLGGALLFSAFIANWVLGYAFISVWCFFAALLSGIVLLHVVYEGRRIAGLQGPAGRRL